MSENIKKYMRLCKEARECFSINPNGQAYINANRSADEAYASLTQEDIQQFIGWIG